MAEEINGIKNNQINFCIVQLKQSYTLLTTPSRWQSMRYRSVFDRFAFFAASLQSLARPLKRLGWNPRKIWAPRYRRSILPLPSAEQRLNTSKSHRYKTTFSRTADWGRVCLCIAYR